MILGSAGRLSTPPMVQMIHREPQESFSTPFVRLLFDFGLVWVAGSAGLPNWVIIVHGVQDSPRGAQGGRNLTRGPIFSDST